MALGSTQSLTEMSTSRILGGKWGRCVRLTTLPPPCAVIMKSGNLNFLEPSGALQACNGTDLAFFTCTEFQVLISYSYHLRGSMCDIIKSFKRQTWEVLFCYQLQFQFILSYIISVFGVKSYTCTGYSQYK